MSWMLGMVEGPLFRTVNVVRKEAPSWEALTSSLAGGMEL